MEEIKAILKKNDIAGFVVLQTQGFSEYLNHLQTSNSCLVVSDEQIRVKLKVAEVGKEKAKKMAEETYNMVTGFSEIIGRHAVVYMDLHDMLKERWGGEDFPGEDTSHRQQNN
jgi:phosphoribosylaminoimidazole (AIR) synthetase